MNDNGKVRGRPKGSSRYAQHDEQLMHVIADLMAADPQLTMTDAIRRLIDTTRDTGGVRRLQTKLRGRLSAMVEESKRRLAEIQHEQQVKEVLDMLDIAVPQALGAFSQWLRDNDAQIRDALFVLKLRNRPKEWLYQRLGITKEGLREVAHHLVAFSVVMRDFSETDGMPHLAELMRRLSALSAMVTASAKLANQARGSSADSAA